MEYNPNLMIDSSVELIKKHLQISSSFGLDLQSMPPHTAYVEKGQPVIEVLVEKDWNGYINEQYPRPFLLWYYSSSRDAIVAIAFHPEIDYPICFSSKEEVVTELNVFEVMPEITSCKYFTFH